MRVFITGGSGWVGSGIIRELLATGHTVTALARSPESTARLAAKGVSIRRGDLADLAGLRAAAAESDAVIHCAFNHEIAFSDILVNVLIRTTQSPWFARVSPVARADLHAIEALVDGLADSPNGAKTFVCTSPIAILPSGRVGTERDSGVASSLGCFRVASERAVLGAARRGVRSAAIRLPPSVHGAGDTGFVPTLIDLARTTGVSAYLRSGETRWPAVHVDDAAALYRIAMERLAAGTLAAGSVLHAVADQGVPFRDLAGAIADRLALGPPAPRKSKHFGSFAMFAGIDNPASSDITQQVTGWRPTHPPLLDDIRSTAYAHPSPPP